MNFDGNFFKVYFIVGLLALLYFIFFRGGLASKQKALTLSSKQFLLATQRDAADPSVVLVDIRSSKEFSAGSIPHSVSIDVSRTSMKSSMDLLPRNKTYYLYCQNGSKAASYSTYLINSGFRNIYYLENGFDEWTQLGYPIYTKSPNNISHSNPII